MRGSVQLGEGRSDGIDVRGTIHGRGLPSFPFQLNLSSTVHRITHINTLMCPEVAQVEL